MQCRKMDNVCRILIYWYPFGISKCKKKKKKKKTKRNKTESDMKLFSECFEVHNAAVERSIPESIASAETLAALWSNAQQ
jgi:hypothetical protein